jgi:hypothetical protein
MVKRGVSRLKGIPAKQKMPITIQILREVFGLLDHFSSPLDIAFWAACLIAFFVFFRKSTILPVSSSSPSGICRSDVRNFSSSSFELVVNIRRLFSLVRGYLCCLLLRVRINAYVRSEPYGAI